VTAVNDAPIISESIDLGAIKEDQPIKFSAKTLLEGAKDVDGDSLYVLEVHVDKEYGIMEYGQDADGNIESFAFVPNENFNGEDVPIYFTVSDGHIKTEGKAVIDVTAVNDAPVIEGSVELGAIKEDTEIKFEASDLLKNASDVDGDNLSILDFQFSMFPLIKNLVQLNTAQTKKGMLKLLSSFLMKTLTVKTYPSHL